MPLYDNSLASLYAGPPDLTDIIDRFSEGAGSEPDYEQPGEQYSGAAERFKGGHDVGDLTPSNVFNPDGSITGRAAVFANRKDLENYARTGSLKTGDPGVGAFGHFTAGDTPYAAIPRDVLARVYGHENAARGHHVEVTAPNGKVAIIEIGDKGPMLRNRANNAVLELNPAATAVLGSGDANGYRYRFVD